MTTTPTKPAPSFRDKESYSELFKPLPKPEPIPTLGGGLRVSWIKILQNYSFGYKIGRASISCEVIIIWWPAPTQ